LTQALQHLLFAHNESYNGEGAILGRKLRDNDSNFVASAVRPLRLLGEETLARALALAVMRGERRRYLSGSHEQLAKGVDLAVETGAWKELSLEERQAVYAQLIQTSAYFKEQLAGSDSQYFASRQPVVEGALVKLGELGEPEPPEVSEAWARLDARNDLEASAKSWHVEFDPSTPTEILRGEVDTAVAAFRERRAAPGVQAAIVP
jgi:hypothetical protein